MARAGPVSAFPEGLVLEDELVTPDEEREALAALETLALREIHLRGQVARRTVRHFGFDYDYESRGLAPADPLPAALEPVRDRAAALAGVEPAALAQTLVTRYPPGAPIGWHRDAAPFGLVVGVSLLAAARLRLQRTLGGTRYVFEAPLPPRSGYVLDGPARSAWQHSIPPVRQLRWSITFRTLRNPGRWAPSGLA